jgi:hypothetical protein
MEKGLDGPQSRPGNCGEEKCLVPLLKIEPRQSKLVGIPSELSRFLEWINTNV